VFIAAVVVSLAALLALAGVLVRLRLRDGRGGRRLTCAQTLTGVLVDPAALAGVARAGATGPIRAPFSGEACVWYRTATWRVDEGGPQLLASASSALPFLLDDGSGMVSVDPGVAEVVVRPGPAVTNGGALGALVHREWLIGEGDAVELRAAVNADGLVAPARGRYLIRRTGAERGGLLAQIAQTALAVQMLGLICLVLTWPR